jgi:hypothetical protein
MSATACATYLDLEAPIRELACMAAIARFYVCETHLPSSLTDQERLDAERVAFAIPHRGDG